MKNISIILILALLFTSCSTTETISIKGTPGTKILYPNMNPIGTIDNTGNLDVTLTSDAYYAYLLSQSDKLDSEPIPFALDFHKKSRAGKRRLRNFLMTWTSIGTAMAVGGLIGAACGAGEAGGGVAAAGALLFMAPGIGVGAPLDSKLSQTTWKYQFQYNDNQTTNENLNLTVCNDQYRSNNYNPPLAQNNSTSIPDTDFATKKIGDKSNKTLSSNASAVSGIYVGTGKLTQDGNNIESYNNIKVIITEKSKNDVSIRVEEEDGSNFFSKPLDYSIKKETNGQYTLTHPSIKTATIKIDKTNNLVFVHPKINIDGSIYKLDINAKKTSTPVKNQIPQSAAPTPPVPETKKTDSQIFAYAAQNVLPFKYLKNDNGLDLEMTTHTFIVQQDDNDLVSGNLIVIVDGNDIYSLPILSIILDDISKNRSEKLLKKSKIPIQLVFEDGTKLSVNDASIKKGYGGFSPVSISFSIIDLENKTQPMGWSEKRNSFNIEMLTTKKIKQILLPDWNIDVKAQLPFEDNDYIFDNRSLISAMLLDLQKRYPNHTKLN